MSIMGHTLWIDPVHGEMIEEEIERLTARIVELEGLWKEALLRLGEVAEENRILKRKIERLEDEAGSQEAGKL